MRQLSARWFAGNLRLSPPTLVRVLVLSVVAIFGTTNARAGESRVFPFVWNAENDGCSQYDIIQENASGGGPCKEAFEDTVAAAAEGMCGRYGEGMRSYQMGNLSNSGVVFMGRGVVECLSAVESAARAARAEQAKQAAAVESAARAARAALAEQAAAADMAKRKALAETTVIGLLRVRREAATKTWLALSTASGFPESKDLNSLLVFVDHWGEAAETSDGFVFPLDVPEVADARRAIAEILGALEFESPTLGVMKWVPAGTFTMGSPSSESGRDSEETQHSVTLTTGYWLMEHEVTQGEWQAVMGSNPSAFTACGPTCPVQQISWDDAVKFARKASKLDGVTYALPTEAQWEYAARGGRTGELYAGSNEATSVGWISDNSQRMTHAVCGKARNGYGLCDMTGNVWEWTADRYGDYGGSATDPKGAATGSIRVYRGGSWFNSAQFARVAYRYGYDPSNRDDSLGFRLSRTGP